MNSHSWSGLALLIACFAATAQTTPVSTGTVKRMEGISMLTSASGERAVQVGSAVYAGDRIVTRAQSGVGITLADGTLLAVGPNSAVTIRTFEFDTTTRQGSLLMDVARGTMRMVSGLIARNDPRAISINTPTATIGIRGTDFVVEVDDEVR